MQISNSLTSQAMAVSATPSGITWTLLQNPVQSGNLPQSIRIANIGNTTAFVNISNNSSTNLVIPGSSQVGNTFTIAPNSFVDIELFDQSGIANSVFNDGDGYCFIHAATVESTTILVISPIQTN